MPTERELPGTHALSITCPGPTDNKAEILIDGVTPRYIRSIVVHLAAQEEREALLEQAKFGSADASVGALVRRIREHKMYGGAFETRIVCGDDSVLIRQVSEHGLESALRYLDSLLPKEPEPRGSGLAPSGGRYRVRGGLLYADDGIEMGQVARVGVEDIPFVAALLEASRGK